jgi:hypothetical protein
MSTYLLARLTESSTWRGIVMLLTAIGVKMDPTQMGAIVSAGMAIAGAIAVFMPDRRTPPPQEPPMP